MFGFLWVESFIVEKMFRSATLSVVSDRKLNLYLVLWGDKNRKFPIFFKVIGKNKNTNKGKLKNYDNFILK